MAIREDLVYFLKNGRLKNINFGATERQLIELLGKPDELAQFKWGDKYTYANFEFYLWKEEWKGLRSERLFAVYTYNPQSAGSAKGNFVFKAYGWTNELTVEEAIGFLQEHKIDFEEKNDPEDAGARNLYTEGNVFIQFRDGIRDWEKTGKFTLYKFGRSIELSSVKPLTKQVSFEIEEDFYKRLRAKAQTTGKSIAYLCREIIENHLEDNN
ncbi:MAG TPA: hypothetical protein VF599_04840 [Pyrinomonadaceae bacterium]|jgi:hypothetical protein